MLKKRLFLEEDPNTCSAAHLLQLQEERRTPQSHFSTIIRGDCNRVKPGVYFNGVSVDFGFNGSLEKSHSRIPLFVCSTPIFCSIGF
jgi:hypothetical protein